MRDLRRTPIRAVLATSATVVIATSLLSGCTPSEDDTLRLEIQDVIDDPAFAGAGWGISVVDLETGDSVYELNPSVPYVPGSIQKSFTTAAALDILGGDTRVTTPVFGTGDVSDGTLDGDLVLAGHGDFSFGLRDLEDGTLEITSFDHNEANTGLLPVELNSGDPLGALRSLAGDLRESGITEVTGNVLVDNSLFETVHDWPDGRVDSIWVNENVVDVEITATAVGGSADLRLIPDLDALSIVNDVSVVAGDGVDVEVTMDGMSVTVTGEFGIDAGTAVRNARVPDPVLFAASAFHEVLADEGVTVLGSEPGPSTVPASPTADPIAEWVSAPVGEFARVVQKISYNRGADLLACLIAVSQSSTDCVDGVSAVLATAEELSEDDANAVRLWDPAGSIDENRSTAKAHVDFLRGAHDTTWGQQFVDLQPISGVDGSLASLGLGTGAVDMIRAKTGTRIHGYPTTGGLFYLARSYSGYMTTESGRDLVFTVILNSATVDDIPAVFTLNDRIAEIVLALQKNA
ncbi:MAG: D-alanyl-D-alanine carboxypeptidase/D-alanyl-D-alanine endopeptidase [Actinomycetota bacterium]